MIILLLLSLYLTNTQLNNMHLLLLYCIPHGLLWLKWLSQISYLIEVLYLLTCVCLSFHISKYHPVLHPHVRCGSIKLYFIAKANLVRNLRFIGYTRVYYIITQSEVLNHNKYLVGITHHGWRYISVRTLHLIFGLICIRNLVVY